MAMEPGGRADKLGNEHERLWVVKQMLLVLMGDATSITWEPCGSEAEGVDLLVFHNNGTRSLESCKRESSKGIWKLGELKSRGVIAAAHKHIVGNTSNRFVFVSCEHCPELRDLSTRSQNHPTAATFYNALSKDLQRSFHRLGTYWGLTTDAEGSDRQELFELIKRFRSIACDLPILRQYVHTMCDFVFDSDTDSSRTLLADFAIQNLGHELNAETIFDYMASKGVVPRQQTEVQAYSESIHRNQASFFDSITPYLINGQMLEREEAKTLYEEVISTEANRPKLFMVHGKAGHGKSGVLYEFAKTLDTAGIPFLPIRLDRNVPKGTISQFGRDQCGLPSSPAHTLKRVAGDKRAVLILDQLDALRWTASHTDKPLDILTEIVREAFNPLNGMNLTVILVCRTFDLQDDPRIAHLRTLANTQETEIGLLTEETAKNIVNANDNIWEELSSSQKLLLRQPQSLYLWSSIQGEEQTTPTFQTHSDLLRAFWRDLYDNKLSPELSPESVKRTLDILVQHMDRNGRLTAPSSLIDDANQNTLAFLKSSGVLRIDSGNQCIFSHQSYFDYLVASELNRRLLNSDTTLVEWIKERDQSLFRRDQLRQILALQRDDNPIEYTKAIDNILNDSDIRFHLKHLILQLVAQMTTPIDQECDLVEKFIKDSAWQDKIYEQVVQKSPAWFKELLNRQVWADWINSKDDTLIDKALRLIAVMTHRNEHDDTQQLEELVARGGLWPERIARAFAYHNPEDHSLALFDLRLNLIDHGHRAFPHVFWDSIAKSRPARAIRLIEKHICQTLLSGQTFRANGRISSLHSGIDADHADDAKPLNKAAMRKPLTIWRKLAPLCLRLERLKHWINRKRVLPDYNSPEAQLARRCNESLELCERLLTAAGRALAEQRPLKFIALVNHVDERPRTSMIERAILRSMESLPTSEADFATSWTISRSRRFRLGDDSRSVSDQEPARRVLLKMSPHCSSDIFENLESKIINYFDPHMRRTVQFQHKNRMTYDGYYPTDQGKAKYTLISALPPERLTDSSLDQLGVWRRHFGEPDTGERDTPTAGFVGSSIPDSKVELISDDDWIELTAKNFTTRTNGSWHRRRISGRGFAEASHEQFANNMAAMASRQPSRFAKLLTRLPEDAPIIYTSRVIRSFQTDTPPESLTKGAKTNANTQQEERCKSELANWNPASTDEIEAIIKRVGFPDDPELAKAICWIIDKRDGVSWSDDTISLLCDIAENHPDPKQDEFASGHYDKSDNRTIIPDVGNSSLNCTRGVSALAIKSVLFNDPNLLPTLQQAIDSLCNDPNIAVRAGAIAVCPPILNIDRDLAVNQFLNLCSTDNDQVFESLYIDHFLRYALWSHSEKIIPLIERMAKSSIPDVAKRGAAWATAEYMYEGLCESLTESCAAGTEAQRRGVAETAGRSPHEEKTYEARIKLLRMLFNDDDKEVRHSTARFFWHDEPWENKRVTELAKDYIESMSFAEDPTPIIHGLSDVKGSVLSLAEIILLIAQKFSGTLASAANDMSQGITGDVPDVFKLLLRVYQQAQDSSDRDLQNACLDCWDALLQSGVGTYHEAEELLDSTEE